jgi:hypothetical protein
MKIKYFSKNLTSFLYDNTTSGSSIERDNWLDGGYNISYTSHSLFKSTLDDEYEAE